MVDLPEEKQPEPPSEWWPIARTERSPNLVKIPSGTERQRCKDATCGKYIYMVKHPKTGKPVPAACEETVKLSDGTVVPTGAFPPYLKVESNTAGKDESLPMDGLGYAHFIDCPSSKAFRRK